MATTYDFPTDICMTEVTLTEANAVGAVVSPYSFKREVQDFGGEQWRMTIEFLPVTRAEAAALEAFISKLRGGLNNFRMGDPYRSLPLGNNLGVPTVAAGATAGAETIATQGWTVSQTDQLKANDLIQIETHLYKVLDDVDSDGGGLATITVWPRLRKAYTAATAITVENPRGVFVPVGNAPTFERNRVGRFWTRLECMEVIS